MKRQLAELYVQTICRAADTHMYGRVETSPEVKAMTAMIQVLKQDPESKDFFAQLQCVMELMLSYPNFPADCEQYMMWVLRDIFEGVETLPGSYRADFDVWKVYATSAGDEESAREHIRAYLDGNHRGVQVCFAAASKTPLCQFTGPTEAEVAGMLYITEVFKLRNVEIPATDRLNYLLEVRQRCLFPEQLQMPEGLRPDTVHAWWMTPSETFGFEESLLK